MSSADQNPATPIENGERYGHLIHLKPEYRERYIALHAHPFPELLDRMRAAGLRNYSIFLRDGVLFSYYEYVGDDFAADMDAMAENETVQDWWTLTDPMQEPLPARDEGAWWAAMEEIYRAGPKVCPTEEVDRKAYARSFRQGSVTEGRAVYDQLGEELAEELRAAKFQNYAVYLLDNRLYTYVEYFGSEFATDHRTLQASAAMKRLRRELDPLLESLSPSADDPKRRPMESVFYMA